MYNFNFLIFSFVEQVLTWRTVPCDNSTLGLIARAREPYVRQVFVTGDQEKELFEQRVSQLYSFSCF